MKNYIIMHTLKDDVIKVDTILDEDTIWMNQMNLQKRKINIEEKFRNFEFSKDGK